MADDIQAASETNPLVSEPGKKVILLIEDDPFLVGIYREKLEIEGYNVLIAEDGLQGLNYAVSQKVDLILLDILIPKLSGIDLLVRLRQDEKGKDVPVIALTNLSGSDDEEKIRSYGVKDYLVKSNYTPGQVVEVIKKYLP
ncbi:MAG: Response regulator receiver protein [Candidatus Woesebacteria bacterium GW2011_GWA1_39_21]|uniref:Response regulator receiver protein n=1 Tax=Candidatus Woesebacteria bacterium GW2011_GWA1_39_21 TaxID=1618550 RepID=A0A0G0N483_9BACT|nr:MAG: Response regulator receiver protein [Candidatus Woesebacteria bacterium GW2011_GWA1_39_21]